MKNCELKLRKCTSGDITSIMNLQESVISELPDKDSLRRNKQETFERCLKHPSTTIGLFDKDELVGMSIIAYERGNDEDLSIGLEKYEAFNSINMKSVMIRKDYYGLGFQRSIMWIMEKLAFSMGFEQMCTTVSPDNKYSRDNIIRCGYLYDHSAIKYSGIRREVFVRFIEVGKYNEQIASAVDRSVGKSYDGKEYDEIINNCYCGDKDIATTGDIAEYVDDNSGAHYFSYIIRDDNTVVVFPDDESGKLQKKQMYENIGSLTLRQIWINPVRDGIGVGL